MSGARVRRLAQRGKQVFFITEEVVDERRRMQWARQRRAA